MSETDWAGSGYSGGNSDMRRAIIADLQAGPRTFASLIEGAGIPGAEEIRRELRRMYLDGLVKIQPPSGADGLAKYRLNV